MIDHPYTPFLWRVDKPGRYVGGEFGSLPVPDQVDVRIALAFPDVYEIGMSHMGLSILYEIIGAIDGRSAERVYMPWPDMEKALREHDQPLVSLESARPISEFDVVGFSLQYELTYTNMLAMLDLSRIPRRAADRAETDPIVLVGGPVAVQCEPMTPFVDIVLLGDGEETLPRLLDLVAEHKANGTSRTETIRALSRLPETYAPNLLDRNTDQASNRTVVLTPEGPVARVGAVKSMVGQPTGHGPVPMIQAVFDRFSVEIARGCTEGCRFCQAGFIYRPVRERTQQDVESAVERAVSCLGFDEASLAALSSADHSQIGKMVEALGEHYTPRRVSLSVPSLRAYGLPDKLVEVLSRLRATGVTLAPEAGTQRLRDAVNKNVSEADLMSAAASFFDHGISRIKLYFMLGLPSETDEDLEAIIDLSVKLRSLGRRRLNRKKIDIVVSVSTFVPKPFTPLERVEMIPFEEIKRRQLIITSLGRTHRLDVRVHDPRLSRLEGVLCRGDVNLSGALETATDLGARFDGWGDMFNEAAWDKALSDVDVSSYLEPIPSEATLPWSHVGVGVSPEFLESERLRAIDGKLTQPCGRFERGEDENPAFVCHSCGLKCAAGDLVVKPRRMPPPPIPDAPPPRPKGHPRPKAVAAPPSEPVKVRMNLAIWGRQTFIGHLDTMRHFMRGMRRAGLEIFYTQGFHPKPKIEAAPPLPLGTACLADPVDVWLIAPPSPAEIVDRMNAALPPDLSVTSVTILRPEDPKLAKAHSAAKYVALVNAPRADVEVALEKLLSMDKLEVQRTRKRRTKTIEIRQYLMSAQVGSPDPDRFNLPPSADRTHVEMTIEVPGSGGTRPAELLGAVMGDAPIEDIWVVRTAWVPAT